VEPSEQAVELAHIDWELLGPFERATEQIVAQVELVVQCISWLELIERHAPGILAVT